MIKHWLYCSLTLLLAFCSLNNSAAEYRQDKLDIAGSGIKITDSELVNASSGFAEFDFTGKFSRGTPNGMATYILFSGGGMQIGINQLREKYYRLMFDYRLDGKNYGVDNRISFDPARKHHFRLEWAPGKLALYMNGKLYKELQVPKTTFGKHFVIGAASYKLDHRTADGVLENIRISDGKKAPVKADLPVRFTREKLIVGQNGVEITDKELVQALSGAAEFDFTGNFSRGTPNGMATYILFSGGGMQIGINQLSGKYYRLMFDYRLDGKNYGMEKRIAFDPAQKHHFRFEWAPGKLALYMNGKLYKEIQVAKTTFGRCFGIGAASYKLDHRTADGIFENIRISSSGAPAVPPEVSTTDWDFEKALGKWDISSVDGDKSRFFVDKKRSFTGKASLRVEKNSPEGNFELISPESFILVPGKSYTATMRYRLESISDACVSAGFYMKNSRGGRAGIQVFFGSTRNDIRHYMPHNGELASPVWKEFTMNIRPARGAEKLHFYVYGGDGKFKLNIDSVTIRESAPKGNVVFSENFRTLASNHADALAGLDMRVCNGKSAPAGNGMKMQFPAAGKFVWETEKMIPEVEYKLSLKGDFPKGSRWHLAFLSAAEKVLAEYKRDAGRDTSFKYITPERANLAVLTLEVPGGTAVLNEIDLRKDFSVDKNSAIYNNIWQCGAYNEGIGKGDGYFRKIITLKSKPKEAYIRFLGHNWVKMFVNGKDLGTGTQFVPGVGDITDVLQPGENCIAIRMRNISGGSKVMFEAYIKEADGTEHFICSDETMKYSAKPAEGWMQPGFDDSKWTPAVPTGGSARDFGNGSTAAVANTRAVRLYIGPRQELQVAKFTHDEKLPADGVFNLKLSGKFSGDISSGRVLFFKDGRKYTIRLEPQEISVKDAETVVSFAPRYLPYGKYTLALEFDKCRFAGHGIQMPLGSCEIVPGGKIIRPSAEIKKHLGQPKMFINGKIQPAAIFCYGRPYSPEITIMSREAGIKIHQLQINIRATKPYVGGGDYIGDGTGEFDFTDTDCIVFDAISQLRNIPDGYLMLQIACQPPIGFGDDPAHQDDLLVTSKGFRMRKGAAKPKGKFGTEYRSLEDMPKGRFSVVSSASEIKRKTYERLVRAVVRHFENTPMAAKIIGYGASGEMDEQWYNYVPYGGYARTLGFADYSPVMLKRFRKYLREVYGTDAALQKAWRDPKVTIDTATIPLHTERDCHRFFVNRRAADFYKALSSVEFSLPDGLLKAIKDEAGRKIVTWIYPKDSYTSSGYIHYGFHALGTVNSIEQYRSSGADMFGNPGNYYYRGNGRPTSNIGAAGSARLNNKIWGPEMDLRSYLIGAYSTSYNPETLMLTRAHWAKEVMSAFKFGASYRVYEFWPGWYNNAAVRDNMKLMADIERAQLELPLRWKPQVCVLTDSYSIANVGVMTHGRKHFFLTGLCGIEANELSRAGASCDVYYLQDILRDDFPADQYKVIIISDFFRADKELTAAIHKKFSGKGQYLIWRWGAGYLDSFGNVDPQEVKKLTGFSVKPMNVDQILPQVTTVPGNKSPLLRDMTTFGGKYRYNCEPTLPFLVLDDPKCEVLARFTNGEAALGVKKFGNATAIYAAMSGLPQMFFRNLYKVAGVHTFVENSSDFISTDGNFLSLHSGVGGKKLISLPEKVSRVINVNSGKTVAENSDKIEFSMRANDTVIFRIEH